MRKFRGFKLGRRLLRFSVWAIRKARHQNRYHRLNSSQSACQSGRTISKIVTWGRRLTNGARSLCALKSGSGYVPLESEAIEEKNKASVPKGYLAVYVGRKDGEFHRDLVPVIYFNHPLFGQLLREAEEEYGFQHQGGITIPCQYSQFEQVKTRIAAGSGSTSRRLTWKRYY